MRVYLTGGLRVEWGDRVIDHRVFGDPQAQLALAYLVCERNRPVARAEIVDLLEQGGPPLISSDDLLAHLGAALTAHLPSSELRSTASTIELVLANDTWVDAEAAADAIHEAESAVRAGRVPDAFGPSAVAHHIARRPFLPGERGSWVEEQRARLRGILVRALEARGEVFLWNNEASLAIEAAREAVKLEPYRETAHRLLMRALAASGNVGEALRAYERCRQILLEGLHVEPSEQTRRAFETLTPSSTQKTPPLAAGPDVTRLPHAPAPPREPAGLIEQALAGEYVIERELAGGMSRVWVATERALDRRVVIKVLPPEMAERVAADRFSREVRLIARLQHPNIVPVLSVGILSGSLPLPYYTMPYVRGESLRAALMATPKLPISRVVAIVRDVARALAFAHGEGVIHRDIKPENILLAGDAAIVTDFGIAKAVADTGTATSTSTGQVLTGVGQIVGTPQYMAPEQLIADPSTDHRADLYSIGVVAYEMLAGHRPFGDGDLYRDLTARLTWRCTDVRTERPDTPAGLAALIMKCLEPGADDRPGSMTEILRDLDSSGSPLSRGLLEFLWSRRRRP